MAGVSGRSRRRVSWGEQEEHRREEREGRRERRTALWAWRVRDKVTRVTSGRGWRAGRRRGGKHKVFHCEMSLVKMLF